MNNDNNIELDNLTAPLWDKIRRQLTQESLSQLTSDQITLLAYAILREQLLEGGFIQLIQNGYGPFIFLNPFAKAMRLWGLKDFSKWLYDARELYEKTKAALETPTDTDEEFMALYEQYPEWDDFDDSFIDFEPEVTRHVCEAYVSSTQTNNDNDKQKI